MKRVVLLAVVCVLGACNGNSLLEKSSYKMQTLRQTPYYLTTQATEVEDTCPGQDILKQYTCSKEMPDGMRCFDVYMVQGSPAPQQRYTLLQETVTPQNVSAQPECPAQMHADCESFLKALDYNLEFSWYLVNFPSSSFEQCRETYDCKRIDCYVPVLAQKQEAAEQATLVSCVFKRNQLFFVGSEVTCRREFR